MKRIFAVLAMAALSGFAFAQTAPAATETTAPAAPMLGQPGSLVEVYGVFDGAIRASTNAGFPSDNPSIGFSQGLFNGSRFGFRGGEDLGNSFRAIYDLEGGIVLPTGASDQQFQLFGRQAWMGVSSDYGKLTFGRTYGTFSDSVGAGDVFGILHGNEIYDNGKGNYGSVDAPNGFFYQELGYRWDDSLKYEANFGGVTLGAQAVLSGVPATTMFTLTNSMFAGSIGYNNKDFPLSGSIGIQVETDAGSAVTETVNTTNGTGTFTTTVGGNGANPNHHTDVGGGLKYALDPTDGIYFFFFQSYYDAGFAGISANDSEMNTEGQNSANNNTVATYSQPIVPLQRTDDIANLAVNYYVLPQLNLIASYYFDYAQNVLTSGDNGMRNSILGVGDYYFTKDVDVYLAAWFTSFSGALQNTKNGGADPLTDSTSFGLNGGGTAQQYGNTGTVQNATSGISTVVSGMLGMRFRF
jgi:predicted porin